jgi:hypothetical protein
MTAEWKKLVKEAERQGWAVTPSRKGLKLVPPDPSKQVVFVHQTPSDQRAMRNAIAEMKRQGLQWPPRGKGTR